MGGASAAIDVAPAAEMAGASLAFGVGITLAFTLAVVGFSRAEEARQLNRRAQHLSYLSLGVFAGLALTTIIVGGLILVART